MSYARVIRSLKEDGHVDVVSMKNKVKIAMSALEKMEAELENPYILIYDKNGSRIE